MDVGKGISTFHCDNVFLDGFQIFGKFVLYMQKILAMLWRSSNISFFFCVVQTHHGTKICSPCLADKPSSASSKSARKVQAVSVI